MPGNHTCLVTMPDNAGNLFDRYRQARELSVALVAPLSDADTSAQSMPDASPVKWHLAHTTWFFETFLLRDHVPGYRLFNEAWPFLFNSYYEAEGPRLARDRRGMLTRPALGEVLHWRAVVDHAVEAAMPVLAERCPALVALGIEHERQHQELLLTDLKHLLWSNPLGPAAWPVEATARSAPSRHEAAPLRWIEGREGITTIGAPDTGFAFDCERPRHRTFLEPHALASRPVSNGEWDAFVADGGYRTPALWLDEGWAWLQREDITAPLYWRGAEGDRQAFTLSGWQPLDPAAPVCHVSFYEAEAFAAWSGARLPTEAEWEAAASGHDPGDGVQLDRAGPVVPRATGPAANPATGPATGPASGPDDLFGNVWEWTGSAYRPYPGFAPAPGAVGEYNGKFMCGQQVLRGGSCATPRGHMRASYRNFFHPEKRWQFSGLRLARSLPAHA